MYDLSVRTLRESRTGLVITPSQMPDLCRGNNKNAEVMGMDDDLQNWMQEWFERFMGRFDRLDNNLESMSARYNFLEGERLLDNHDLCQLLHVSKRTLQRYRSSGELPYQTIYHKTYYRESDVDAFINEHFSRGEDEEPDNGDNSDE